LRPEVHILLIDNFDSFSFNLVDEFSKRRCPVQVWRNDISAAEAVKLVDRFPGPGLIVLSPGPGRPADAGCCMELVRKVDGSVPVFGVCLGHQVIVEAYGGRVDRAEEVVHGKASQIAHNGRGLYAGMPSPLQVGRYHSLAAAELPQCLEVTARCGDLIMGVQHVDHPVVGVQFHPESILTAHGGDLIERLLDWVAVWKPEETGSGR
jgi:anthranilate synthase component 2